MTNEFQVFGRLVSDVEIIDCGNDKVKGTIRVAVRKEFKNFNGEYDTDFVKITLWNNTAQNSATYLKKGDQVLVGGRLSTYKYDLGDDKHLNMLELVGEKVVYISRPNNELSS